MTDKGSSYFTKVILRPLTADETKALKQQNEKKGVFALESHA